MELSLTKIPGYSSKVDALAKEAETKGEEGLKAGAVALKTALDAKDRKAIGEAAGKLEKAVKDVKDKDLNKKADKLAKDIKGDAGSNGGEGLFGRKPAKGSLSSHRSSGFLH